jgi:hypothetical protein
MPIFRTVVLFCLLIVPTLPARAADPVFDHTTGTRGTRLWIPPGVQTVKGIVIYGNGAGGDSRNEVFTPWNQQLAALHNFAVIGTSMWGNLAGTEINTWDAHLAAIATASGHPELVNAPWAPIGFSNGGQMSYGFNALRPEKTIAFIANKGCCYNNPAPPAASLKTPGVLIAGELDTQLRRDNIRALFDNNRPPRGALWSWVEEEGHAHIGRADSILIPFMDAAIRARYPAGQAPTATSGVTLLPVSESNGWLADQSSWKSGLTKIASYNDYAGNKSQAGWLLDKGVAFTYRAFSTYNRVVSLSFDGPTLSDEIDSTAALPSTLKLKLDLSAVPGWTKVQLLNYSDPVLEQSATSGPGGVFAFDVPIFHTGVYAFSALVTHADGVTVSTTKPLAFTALPEPATAAVVLAGFLCIPARRRLSPRAVQIARHARHRALDLNAPAGG